jgi:ferrous iron transport protein B
MNLDTNKSAILIGNVNVGKTTIFNRISGRNVREEKGEGSTVSYYAGDIKGTGNIIYDMPGFSGLIIQNEEEKTIIDILLNKKIGTIIQVLDAKNIKRSLALALQMMEFGIPSILDLNMIDEAQSKGIQIDARKLEKITGLEVIETIANENEGLNKLPSSIGKSRISGTGFRFTDDIENCIAQISSILEHSEMSRALAILILLKDRYVRDYVIGKFGINLFERCSFLADALQKTYTRDLSIVISEIYFFHAKRIADQIMIAVEIKSSPLRSALSRYTSKLFPGIPIAVLIGTLMFLFVGKFGAQILVNLLEGGLFKGMIIPFMKNFLNQFSNSLLTDLFCGEFGILSVGITLAFGVVLPVLFTFYIFFGFLEDSGYLPRLSILLDKSFRKIGLNGKGVLPLIMGFSCITMAILTTRMLDTKKEKFILTLLLVLGIPCAPLLSVMFILFGKLHWTAICVVFGIILIQLVIIGMITNRILPGKRGDFIMELPLLRMPSFPLILKRTFLRTKTFLIEAVPVFVITSVILFVFDKAGGITILRTFLRPVVYSFLGLPAESVEIIIMTVIRREAGAALLNNFYDAGLFSGEQTVIMLLLMALLLPCINAIIILFKERGIKSGLFIICFSIPYALILASTVNFILTNLQIKF